VNGRGGLQADSLADLPDSGRIAPADNLLLDKIQNLLLLRSNLSVCHKSSSLCFDRTGNTVRRIREILPGSDSFENIIAH
jgi:hypothetical protein